MTENGKPAEAKKPEEKLFVGIGIRKHTNGKFEAGIFVSGIDTELQAKAMAAALKDVVQHHLTTMQTTQ